MKKYNHFSYQNAAPFYYGQLKVWAKEMRAKPTEAEAILRDNVRANNLGHKFLYQYIIGQFIVDFLCPDSKLVIEVDGGYHSEIEQEYDDEQRSLWLEKMGYKVIRFSNEQVISDIDNVLKEIKKYLQ
jgi:very-short-patch-repair endonuclease